METTSFKDIVGNNALSDWFANQLSNFTPFNVALVLIAARAL